MDYVWRPIEGPEDPGSLAVRELTAFRELWERQRSRLLDARTQQAFNERMARRWAVETGIIERLYDVSEGVTVLLVEHGFDASLVPHGESTMAPEDLVRVLNDHREGLALVMDLVGGTRPLSVGWIKELHVLLTRHQEATEAQDQFGGVYRTELLRGDWKKLPNNPRTPDGRIHEYCPPEQVASEMDRLVDIYASLPKQLPEVRAAWLHHAFTQIHPFQDGNGRVARALASIDFIRSGLFPVLVHRSQRADYLDALRTADRGDLSPLVTLFAELQKDALARAVSEADATLQHVGGLDSVLDAATQRLKRRTDHSAQSREVLRVRMQDLMDEAQRMLAEADRLITQKLISVTVPEVQRATDEQRWWFRHQILEIAKQHGYWVDLNEFRDWVRLQIRDGGATDIVAVAHFIGRASEGAGSIIVFVEHRETGASLGQEAPMSAAIKPFLMVADEEAPAQRQRFLAWFDQARTQALAQWTHFL